MRKGLTTLLVILLALGAVLVSCKAEIEAPADELVAVSFEMNNSRSLTATLESFAPETYYWKYAASKNEADTSGLHSGETAGYDISPTARKAGAQWIHEDTEGLAGKVSGFSQGLWDFTLYAYKDVAGAELAYLGEATAVTLERGSTTGNMVHVVVSPAPTGTGTLIIGETSLKPKKTGDTPSVSRFLKVEDLDGTEYTPTTGTTYKLDAGAYKVTVTFKASGIVYAEGTVMATIYPNMTTTVSGSVDELVTYAQFEAEQNPDIIARTAEVKNITAGDEKESYTLNDTIVGVQAKVSAVVPGDAARKLLTEETEDANASMALALNVDTTDSTSTSVTYDISMTKIITLNSEVSTSDVETLGTYTEGTVVKKYYAIATVKLSTGLTGVAVTHDGHPMVESDSTGADKGYGVFFYNATTGILTIQTNTFSPFKVTYDGETAGVAEVNGVKYATLSEAVKKAPADATVKLLSDAEGAGLFLPANLSMNIVLDLDGHTYTCTGPAVGSPGTENQAIHLEKNNTVTIKDGTITSTPDSGVSKMLVQNYCNLTLENVILDGSNVGEGKYTLSNNSGTVVLKGSTSIIPPHNGKALDSCKYGSYAIPNVTINTSGIIDGIIELSGGKLEILNGNFSGSISTESGYQEGDAVIKGGIFDYDPTAYVASGYEVVYNSSTKLWTVVPSGAVAKIGSVYYQTLPDAITAAVDGDTVELLRDIEVTSQQTISNKAIVLDGHEFSLISTEPYSAGHATLYVSGTKSITLKDITIKGAFDAVDFNLDGGDSRCSIIFSGSTFEGGFKSILFNTCKNADIVFTNSDTRGVYGFNVNGGSNLTWAASGTTFGGWNSASNVFTQESFVFTECEFIKAYGYSVCKPYGSTTYNQCKFGYDYRDGIPGNKGIATGVDTPISLAFNGCLVQKQDGTYEALDVTILQSMLDYDITSGSSSGASTINKQYWYIDGECVLKPQTAEVN